MNKNTINTFIVVAIAVLALGLFLKILPYLIIAGLVTWAAFKVYGYFNSKKQDKRTNKSYTSSIYTEDVTGQEDVYNTSEAIDVDYKDVN